MKISNYDSVQKHIGQTEGTVSLNVLATTTDAESLIITVESATSPDLAFKLRVDKNTVPPKAGKAIKIDLSTGMVLDLKAKPVERPKPKTVGTTGCADVSLINI